MAEQLLASSKRTRGAYSRLICLGCHERRIKCEFPDEIAVPDPGELRTTSSPCYRCKKLGVPCVVRCTRLGRPGPGGGLTTAAAENQEETRSVAIGLPPSRESYDLELRKVVVPISQPDSRPSPIPRCMNSAKIQILPLRRASAPPKLPVTSEDASSSSDGRPITAKRTRASKPKVKTGCLTCKIRRVCDLLMLVTSSLTFLLDQV
jgi:hypothetical protein